MDRVLTIVGASVRAAAQSAVRAGFRVRAADLFADADLCRSVEATRVANYPADFLEFVRRAASGAWMYGGALENYPPLVDALARLRPLLGNAGPVLRRVRDPRLLAEALENAGHRFARVTLDPQAIPCDGSWLCKPRRSAGGARIACWTDRTAAARPTFGHYFQQYVEGRPCSAVYVAAGGQAVRLGITRQLIAEAWLAASGFQYCGSIGPISLSAATNTTFDEIGNVLARRFGLVGLFGVDAIVNSAGVWPVEVNPRYTASVEIIERAIGLRAVALHVLACEQQHLPPRVEPVGGPLCGKAILFARSPLRVSAVWTEQALAARDDACRPAWADIPPPDSVIDAGRPVVSMFAVGADEGAVLAQLRRAASNASVAIGDHGP